MKTLIYHLFVCAILAPSLAASQDRSAITAEFRVWLEQRIWPRAQTAGVSRATFDAALKQVNLNFDLPDLVIAGQPVDTQQFQAEFRPPARYFSDGPLAGSASAGRDLLARHKDILRTIERDTGVPAQIVVAIWGRESSYGKAAIPHDAFQILSTKGFMSTRSAYFSQELIAALEIVENGFATIDQMKSSWAGALGQPQFMPTNYLEYAVDGDGDGRVDIWGSQPDTLASIAAYLRDHGWTAGRDWGFEVVVPDDVPCYAEGPDQGRMVRDWVAMGITRVSGQAFPAPESAEEGYLLMPAGRLGPAFIVTSNFYVLKEYNESDVYALFVGHVGDRMRFGVGGLQGDWRPIDPLLRTDVVALQTALEGLGYDVGGVDGLIGNKTRRAIGEWQAQTNAVVTCYPSQNDVAALVK